MNNDFTSADALAFETLLPNFTRDEQAAMRRDIADGNATLAGTVEGMREILAARPMMSDEEAESTFNATGAKPAIYRGRYPMAVESVGALGKEWAERFGFRYMARLNNGQVWGVTSGKLGRLPKCGETLDVAGHGARYLYQSPKRKAGSLKAGTTEVVTAPQAAEEPLDAAPVLLAIRATWNGTEVLSGHATAVMGFDMARAFFEQFAGVEHAQWMARTFAPEMKLLETLRRPDGLPAMLPLRYADETGAAEFTFRSVGEVRTLDESTLCTLSNYLASAANRFDEWADELALPEVAAQFRQQANEGNALSRMFAAADSVVVTASVEG